MKEPNAAPTFSVVILTKNTPLMILKRCLQSIEKQTLQKAEIILLDANSPESPYKKAIFDDSALLNHVTCLEYPEDGEYCKGKMAALQKCTGNYITFLSAQDIMSPGRLQAVHAVFQKNSCDAVCTAMTLQQKDILEVSAVSDLIQTFQFLPQLIIRREALENIGGFDADLLAHCDNELYFRIQSHLQMCFFSSKDAVIAVNADFYQNTAPLEKAIGYRQIAVKYAVYFKKQKKTKKALYYKTAEQYKTAGVLFRFLQFTCKAFFTGNLQRQPKRESFFPDPETESADTVTLHPSAPAAELTLSQFLQDSEAQKASCLLLISDDEGQFLKTAKIITRQLKQRQQLTNGKIAKIPAVKLNTIDIASFREQLNGNCLLAEQATHLTETAFKKLLSFAAVPENHIVILLTASRQSAAHLMRQFTELQEQFQTIETATITISEKEEIL